MIAVVRKMLNTHVYKIFLWVFLIMMSGIGGLFFFEGQQDRNFVARVYEQSLTDTKFAAIVKNVKQQQEMFRQRGYALNLPNPQKEAVRAAISDLLMKHIIAKLGLALSGKHVDSEVQKQLQQLPAYFFDEKGMLNTEAFSKLIAPNTIDDFVESVESDAKNRLVSGLLDVSLYAPHFELELQYDSEFANKTYEYFVLSYADFLANAKKTAQSDEVLQKFYKKSAIAEQFKSVERRSGTMWTFSPAEYGATVTKEEAQNYYDKNKTSLYQTHPAQMQVRLLTIAIEPGKEQETIARIQGLKEEAEKNPAAFETLVHKFSDDKAAAAKGGLTPLFSKESTNVDRIVIDTAFEYLGSDNQISAPVKLESGYTLIQRVKKVPASYKAFSAVEDEIKKSLASDKFKKRFTQDAGRVVSSAKYDPKALRSFIERYKGKESKIGLTANSADVTHKHLFRLEEGRYSQFLDKEHGVIILCDVIERSSLPPFADVKNRVQALYWNDHAASELKQAVKNAQEDSKSMNFSSLAEKYHATIKTAEATNDNGKIQYSQKRLEAPEVQARLKAIVSPGTVIAIETKEDGLLVQLVKVQENRKDFDLKKDEVKKVLFYTKLYQSRDAFIASLYRIAKLNNKIEIKSEILQSTKEV